MTISELETPALVIDRTIMMQNLAFMQQHADAWKVALRPHTKTHKTPEIARLQLDLGARGITVAKTGEAEVMVAHGIDDVFIANEIVGISKLQRIKTLCGSGALVSFGIDSIDALRQVEQVFTADTPAHVLIEVETGENRSGVTDKEQFLTLLRAIQAADNVCFDGIFSHEGHTYSAADGNAAMELFETAQNDTLAYVELARSLGITCKRVSIGSTPSLFIAALRGIPLQKGITEIRPGTYVFMDAGQANAIGTYEQCAASVLATVISKPTNERVIADAGAKALTMQSRGKGICQTEGKGRILWDRPLEVTSVFDEHTIIIDRAFHDAVAIGDHIRIVPNHICPVVNLYDHMHIVENGNVVAVWTIAGRGKIT
ncbi:MAG TPA: alanine racemase [Sphaerochaeta sp.]|nr:alanine racemase [Sphaerochaeta sp.]